MDLPPRPADLAKPLWMAPTFSMRPPKLLREKLLTRSRRRESKVAPLAVEFILFEPKQLIVISSPL